MLTNDAICTSQDIRLYSDKLISVKSIEDNVTYWFSKRGLPWGLRENHSFLRNRNYDPESYVSLSSNRAASILADWKRASGCREQTENAEILESGMRVILTNLCFDFQKL